MDVEPLLVFSRAWVDRPLAKRKGVRVLPATMLLRYLKGRPSTLDAGRIEELHTLVLQAAASATHASQVRACDGRPGDGRLRGGRLRGGRLRGGRLRGGRLRLPAGARSSFLLRGRDRTSHP